MSSSSLRNHDPAPASAASRERLQQFAIAMGRRDRSRHQRPLRDGDVERAIRGYAYAAAMAEHRLLCVNGADIDDAIASYRDARRLPVPHEPVQRSLI